MAVYVLPGAVAQLLTVSEWNEYNILVYESEAGELVVCNDETLLQVISLGAAAPKPAMKAAFNPENGAIAISTGASLVLYEAIETFGQLPRWVHAFTAADVPAHSVAWLSRDEALVTTNTNDCLVWSVSELRTLWSTSLLSPSGTGIAVESASGAGAFATRDATNLVKLWKPKGSNYDFVYLPHGTAVTLCWFVSPAIVATMAAHTVFLWRVATASLLASVPVTRDTVRPLLAAKEPELILVQTASRGIWQLELKKAGSGLRTSEWSGPLELSSNAATMVFATSRRIYSVLPATKAIEVYDLAPRPTKLGSLSGVVASGSRSLSTYENTVLAGKTVLRAEQTPSALPVSDEIVLSCLTSSLALLATKSGDILCYEDDVLLWSHKLAAPPLLLASHDAFAVLVTVNKLVLLHVKTGQQLLEKSIQVEAASAYGSRLLLRFKTRLSLWTLSPSAATQIAECETQDDRLSSADVSLGSDLAVAALRGDNTVLRVWTAGSSINDRASIDLGATHVLCTQWSQDAHFLAVLAAKRVLVFATTRTDTLVLVGEGETLGLKPTSLAWTADLHVVLFNGQQLIYRRPAPLDETGRRVLTELGVSGAQASLVEMRDAINTDMPVYHPRVVLAFVLALRPGAAYYILEKLWRALRFADTTSDGVALLDPLLGLCAADLAQAGAQRSVPSWPVQEFQEQVGKSRPMLVQRRDATLLQQLISTLGDAGRAQQLDPYAIAYECLLLTSSDAESPARVYASLSQSKPELLSSIDAAADTNLAFWLERDALADITEQRAKARFAREREPTTVTLPYVALRKMSVLLTLWRISAGHPERDKTLKFLGNDFTTERWRLAAHKNAYALLSKHRSEYAAAFFLLGDSVSDCCQVLVSKVQNIELAVATARLYDGDAGQGVRTLGERWLGNDAWLKFWCAMLTNANRQEVLDAFAKTTLSDYRAVFVYADQGGQFDDKMKTQWKEELQRRGFGEPVCSALVDSLQPKAPPAASARADAGNEARAEEGSPAGSRAALEDEFENRPLPAHLKPAPAALQLEPDMSAFGF